MTSATPAPWVGLRRRVQTHLAVPLYRNGYALVVGYGAGSLLGLVFWVVAARQADSHTVGVAAALFSLVLLVSGASQLSLYTVLLRFVPLAGAQAPRLVVGCYAVSAGLALLAGGGVALSAPLWSDDLTFLADDARWFVAFAVACAGWSVFALQDSAMIGARAAQWVMVENSLFSVVRVAMVIPLAVIGASGIFAAAIVPALIALIPVNILLFRRLLPRHIGATGGRAEPLNRRALSRFIWSNYLGSLFVVSSFLLPILVTGVAGPQDNAYFYAAWTIAVGLQLIAVSMMVSLLVEGSLSRTRLAEHSRRALKQTLRLVIPAAVMVASVAPWLLGIFGQEYAVSASWSLRILALSAIPNVIVTLAINMARVQQRAGVVVWIQAAACVVGVGLGALLLPSFGITGVSVGWAVGQLIVGLGVVPWVWRILAGSSPGAQEDS